jgi:hypothetical protein
MCIQRNRSSPQLTSAANPGRNIHNLGAERASEVVIAGDPKPINGPSRAARCDQAAHSRFRAARRPFYAPRTKLAVWRESEIDIDEAFNR